MRTVGGTLCAQILRGGELLGSTGDIHVANSPLVSEIIYTRSRDNGRAMRVIAVDLVVSHDERDLRNNMHFAVMPASTHSKRLECITVRLM